jgi:hypothetical protein
VACSSSRQQQQQAEQQQGIHLQLACLYGWGAAVTCYEAGPRVQVSQQCLESVRGVVDVVHGIADEALFDAQLDV